jgi:hypothetical protein
LVVDSANNGSKQLEYYEPAEKQDKVVRDNMRFRSIGLITSRYDGPLEFLGTDYGGYMLPRREIRDGLTCYCFGAGEDISFESELAAAFPVEVHVFDPTPRAIAYARGFIEKLSGTEAGRRLHFHPWGVWSSDQQMQFYAPKNPAHVSHSVVDMQHTTDYSPPIAVVRPSALRYKPSIF